VIADETAGALGASNDVPNLVGAWATYVNSHGGINGHPVKWINEDSAADAAKTHVAVETLISDHVDVIMDNSTLDSTWASVATAANIPVISLDESAAGLTFQTQPDFFADGTTVLGILYGHVAMPAAAGKKVFGGIYCTEVAQCKQAVSVWKADAPSAGIKFAVAVGASETAPNYTAQCLVMKEDGVDALFPAGPPANRIADNCAQQGYHPLFIGSEGTLQLSFASDANLNGALQNQQGFPWMATGTPALDEFHAVEGRVVAHSNNPALITAGWTGLKLAEAALASAPASAAVTPQTVYTGLYSLHGDTLGGLSPTPLTFVKGKPNSQNCYFITEIQNGKWIAPQGLKPQCAPGS
jgi:branched-chain amino acid transport system substrate-binding protein